MYTLPSSTTNLLVGGAVASVGAASLATFLWKYYRWMSSPLWELQGPPRKSWLVGQLVEMATNPVFESYYRWLKQSGEEAEVDMMHYSTAFGHHSLLLLDANLVKQVLMSRAHKDPKYIKLSFMRLEKVLGDGLVTLSGENWHRHRRIINPSFQVSFLKEKLTAVVPEVIMALISHWCASPDRVIDISSHLSQVTLDIIGVVGFSHDFRGMESIAKWAEQEDDKSGKVERVSDDDPIVMMREVFKFNSIKVLMYIFKLDFLDFERLRTVRALNRAVDEVVETARSKAAAAAVTREHNEATNGSNGKIKNEKYAAKSILELLFNARDTEEDTNSQLLPRTLQDHELRDEIKTFILAGHETTSTWCTWAVLALCQYPDVQQRVYEDIIQHAPHNPDSTISIEDMENMTYFQAFLNECLRFYAPVPIIARDNVYQEVDFNGTVIPPDTRMVIPIHMLHRSERYWSEPLEFQPERWLDSNKPPYSHPFAYLPFSAGPRNCIGHKFAELEAKLIMAHLIRAVRFQLESSLRHTDFEYSVRIFSMPKPSVRVCVQQRYNDET